MSNETILKTLFSGKMGKKYLGKHVVIVNGRAFILPPENKRAKVFMEKLKKQNPKQIPQIVFVPRPETYILLLW